MAAATECCICMDKFNKSTHKATICAYCNVGTCRTCIQTYLLDAASAEPNCPSCRAVWSLEFMADNLTATFRNKQYKLHRENILLEREKARFPEAMADAERYVAAKAKQKAMTAQISEIQTQIGKLPEAAVWQNYIFQEQQQFKAFKAKRITKAEYDEFTKARVPLQAAYNAAVGNKQKILTALLDEEYRAFGMISSYGRAIRFHNDGTPAVPTPPAKVEKVFIHKCPAAECDGFLNKEWTCGICSALVCKHCHEIVGGAGHSCDPKTVESVKAIAKEAKPCPKCAATISKIDGCDQMWCTQCKTAFSWKTGAIETTVIHNPHYYQWMRESGQVIPRTGAVAPNMGNCNAQRLEQWIAQRSRQVPAEGPITDTFNRLCNAIRNVPHQQIWFIDMAGFFDKYSDEWYRKLRVQRLVKEVDDETMKVELQRAEKAKNKLQSWRQIRDMFVATASDVLGQLLNGADENSVLEQYEKLREFTNKEADKIAKIYGCVTRHV